MSRGTSAALPSFFLPSSLKAATAATPIYGPPCLRPERCVIGAVRPLSAFPRFKMTDRDVYEIRAHDQLKARYSPTTFSYEN